MLEHLHQGSGRQRKKLAQVARRWARGQLEIPNRNAPDESKVFDEALASFGLQQDDAAAAPAPADKCYLWPCNVRTFVIWQRLQTQWRVGGMGDRTGLDYDAVIRYLHHVERLKPKAHGEVFRGLQVMEWAALEVWAEKQA